jgi:hypothetical protein
VKINPTVYSIFNVSLHLAFTEKQGLRLDSNPEFPSRASIRERRGIYIQLYHEAMAFCPEDGYSLEKMLLLLSYYKPIVASHMLTLVHASTSAYISADQ